MCSSSEYECFACVGWGYEKPDAQSEPNKKGKDDYYCHRLWALKASQLDPDNLGKDAFQERPIFFF